MFQVTARRSKTGVLKPMYAARTPASSAGQTEGLREFIQTHTGEDQAQRPTSQGGMVESRGEGSGAARSKSPSSRHLWINLPSPQTSRAGVLRGIDVGSTSLQVPVARQRCASSPTFSNEASGRRSVSGAYVVDIRISGFEGSVGCICKPVLVSGLEPHRNERFQNGRRNCCDGTIGAR